MSEQIIQDDQGEWGPVVPLPYQPGYDAEVYATWKSGHRRLHWKLYRAARLVAFGDARTKLGVTLATWRAKRWDMRWSGVVDVMAEIGHEPLQVGMPTRRVHCGKCGRDGFARRRIIYGPATRYPCKETP